MIGETVNSNGRFENLSSRASEAAMLLFGDSIEWNEVGIAGGSWLVASLHASKDEGYARTHRLPPAVLTSMPLLAGN